MVAATTVATKMIRRAEGVARIRAARVRAAEAAAEPIPVIHLLSGRLGRR
jgi:hypothetical protein